jgi:hypothetical protein
LQATLIAANVRRKQAKINKNSVPAKPAFGIFVFPSFSAKLLHRPYSRIFDSVRVKAGFFIYATSLFSSEANFDIC